MSDQCSTKKKLEADSGKNTSSKYENQQNIQAQGEFEREQTFDFSC